MRRFDPSLAVLLGVAAGVGVAALLSLAVLSAAYWQVERIAAMPRTER